MIDATREIFCKSYKKVKFMKRKRKQKDFLTMLTIFDCMPDFKLLLGNAYE